MATLKNKKHERFCREYVIDHNGTQAAIRTGYSIKGAEVRAYELLRISKITDRLEELEDKVSDKLELTAEKILTDIENLRELALEDKQFSVSLKASELQGKHKKMFVEKIEHSGKVEVEHGLSDELKNLLDETYLD